MNVKDCQVYFASDLKDYGRTDDGQQFIGEVFFVGVENDRGDRWRLDRMFDGVRVEYDDESGCNYFLDTRPWARAICERLVAAIVRKGEIDLAHWVQSAPAYGSRAYEEYGQYEQLMREKMEG